MRNFVVQFKVRFILLFLSIILIVGLLIFYFGYYQRGVEIMMIDVMSYLTGSVAILTLLYHAFSLEAKHDFHKESIHVKKSQYAYDVMSKFNEPYMTKALQFLHELDCNKDTYFKDNNVKSFLEYLEEKDSKEHEKRQNVVLVLNYFEMLAILIKQGHIEEKIVKQSFKTTFIQTFKLLKPYIDYNQKISRTIWVNYEKLAGKWEQE